MEKLNIGFLHPGAMGVSLAASAQNTGHSVYWISEGRSQETKARAEQIEMTEVRNLGELGELCSVIVCVCPPHAASEVAKDVLGTSFKGTYLDANAISPRRVIQIGVEMKKQGINFVDGGIIGGPAWEDGKTWLYLSGEEAQLITECFSAGPLETEILGDVIGDASSLKMCYAAYTKGTTALICACLAAAEKLGVREQLEIEWSRDGTGFEEQARNRVRRVTAKAWRFEGEMEEIASTFQEAGVPGGFHVAAAEIYRRLSHFRGADNPPIYQEVLREIHSGSSHFRN